jgi:hypothetical protein
MCAKKYEFFVGLKLEYNIFQKNDIIKDKVQKYTFLL